MKFITVLRSRFLKNDEESWVKDRREACATCPYNSKNKGALPFKRRVIKALSDFLTFITFAESKDLGICQCDCPIFYLTAEPESECYAKNNGDEKDRWKSIYISNKK